MLKTKYEKFDDAIVEITLDVPDEHRLDSYINNYYEAIDKINKVISVLETTYVPELGTEDIYTNTFAYQLEHIMKEIKSRAETLERDKELDIMKTRKIKVYKAQ